MVRAYVLGSSCLGDCVTGIAYNDPRTERQWAGFGGWADQRLAKYVGSWLSTGIFGRSPRGSLVDCRAAVGGEFFRAEDVVVQKTPTAGRSIQEHRHQGSAKGQALRHGHGDQPGVGEQEDRQQVTCQRDPEVQRRGPDIESLLPGGTLELEAAGRTRLVHLEDLPRHKECLAAAVGAAVAQATGEDVDAGDFHGEKAES